MKGMSFEDEAEVAVERLAARYPTQAPFHPHVRYPEYEGPLGSEENHVYGAVRQLFVDLGLDASHRDTPDWNPLSEIIRPADVVFIKPNIVLHTNYSGDTAEAVVTHGSVIRAVADYVLRALGPDGRLAIGDAPVQQCDFAKATQLTGLDQVAAYLAQVRPGTELHDLRLVTSSGSKLGLQHAREGDPLGYSYVDLAGESEHQTSNDYSRFRVTNYDPSAMRRHHNEERHEYIVANSILSADVVISISKLKTHRKAGVSVTLKNLVGINGHKDCLPHHKTGSRLEGGDEYLEKSWIKRQVTRVQEVEDVQTAPLMRFLTKVPKRILLEIARRFSGDRHFEGSWWGNDTIWRTVVDLNRILYYWCVKEARLVAEPQRRLLSIVDGVIAGEGEGPLHPTAIGAGVLMAGLNPAAVDAVAARIMGFDWRKIKVIAQAMRAFARFEPDSIESRSSNPQFRGTLLQDDRALLSFQPPRGWAGHMERDGAASAAETGGVR